MWAVRDVSWLLPAGRLVGVYGVSGSGKTTLLNLIAGLDVASEGQVLVDGADIGTWGEDRRASLRLTQVGVIFQEHNLLEEFSAAENVMLPLEAAGMDSMRARVLALAELARVGLNGLADRHPSQMSGGQRQRVGIARALVGGRQILVADEPSGALDSGTSRSIFKLLRGLADSGTTVVVATHDPIIREFAHEHIQMVDGNLGALEPLL